MGLPESVLILGGVSYLCAKRVEDGIKSRKMGSVSRMQLTTSIMLGDNMLAAMRLGIGLLQLGLLAIRFYNGPVSTVCNDDVTACIPYGGVWITSTFTIWCWILQGIYFISVGTMTIAKWNPSPRVRLGLWIIYEVSLCVSVLVFLVVWLVLIPVMDRKLAVFQGSPEQLLVLQKRQYGMKQPFAVLVHTANLWFMLLETASNSLDLNRTHFVFALLFGALYVVFSWLWYATTGIWYYFFLDYRNWWASLAYLALMLALFLFYRVGMLLSDIRHKIQQPLFYGSALLSTCSVLVYYHTMMAQVGVMEGVVEPPPTLVRAGSAHQAAYAAASSAAGSLISSVWGGLGLK